MQLVEANVGDICRVINIELPEKIQKRLQMLGMTNNSDVEVLKKKYSGTMIIKIRGTRFALGKKFAKGIVCEKKKAKNGGKGNE